MTVILEFLRARTTSWGMCSLSHLKILGHGKPSFLGLVFLAGGQGGAGGVCKHWCGWGHAGFAPVRCWGDGDVHPGACVCTA